jgi:hypothetical protein
LFVPQMAQLLAMQLLHGRIQPVHRKLASQATLTPSKLVS